MHGIVVKKYGNDINTDYIIPSYLLQESWDKQFFATHAFERYDPSFVPACRAGQSNIVVAGDNFGCGSSREQAVYAIKYNNVIAVVARSFPDIFYRNSLNNGLLPLQVERASTIAEGDELHIDLEKRLLTNITCHEEYPIIATDVSIREMKKGGVLGYVRKRLEERLKAPPRQISTRPAA